MKYETLITVVAVAMISQGFACGVWGAPSMLGWLCQTPFEASLGARSDDVRLIWSGVAFARTLGGLCGNRLPLILFENNSGCCGQTIRHTGCYSLGICHRRCSRFPSPMGVVGATKMDNSNRVSCRARFRINCPKDGLISHKGLVEQFLQTKRKSERIGSAFVLKERDHDSRVKSELPSYELG